MTKIAYFDCSAGAAGDMILASLIDAGAPIADIEAGLATILDIRGEWGLATERVWKSTGRIAATKVNVSSVHKHAPMAPPGSAPHDHHHDHVHDHDHHHDHHNDHDHHHDHDHLHDHGHQHDHGHDHKHHGDDLGEDLDHAHDHERNLASICAMLDASGLSPWVREKSKDVFACLARAEARAHGASVDQVHFHEVGAIDSIIDTVGSVLALELLHVDEVHCSPLPYSNGFVKCMHGLMPVPVPATLDLMQGVPVIPAPKGQSTGELVTPTGMSLMKALATSFGPPPAFIPHTHGSGAGTKDFPGHANIVRVVIGDAAHPVSPSPTNDESVVVLETNLDDMNPQILSHVQELLFDQGALDVWWQPIQMKKNRPGILLSVLCLPNGVNALSTTLFCETTTLGIRRRTMERAVLKRSFMTVTSLYGPASVKVGYLNGAPVNVQPEFDGCQKLALAANVPIKTVLAEVQALARASLKKEAPVA